MPLSGAAREGLALLHPSNRLVAATLEQRWNDALVRLEEIRTQFADFQSKEAIVVTPEQRARVAALAQDFPRLWNAPTTKAKDKKRILRLLIKRTQDRGPACPMAGWSLRRPRSLRRRRFAARNGSPAHDLSHVSGRLRRSAGRGGFSVVGEQMTKFGPHGPHRPPEPAMRIDLSPL